MKKDKRLLLEAMLVGLRDELVEKCLEVDGSRLDIREGKAACKVDNDLLSRHEKKKIQAIDYTLNRLQQNMYDRCELCGETIAESLLIDSLPWASRCAACQSEFQDFEDMKRSEKQESLSP